MFFCRTLLSGLDGRGLMLNYLLLDVSPPSMSGIFRSGHSGSQMSSLFGAKAYYIAERRPAPEEENSAIDHGHYAWTIVL